MSTRNFGLSNIYLKVALPFLAISVVMFLSVFVLPSNLDTVAIQVASFLMASGIVLYAIGRLAQFFRSRTQS